MKNIGNRIKAKRLAANLTQERLGELSGVSKGAISLIESGDTKTPKGDTLDLIAKTLNVTTGWLLRGENLREESATYTINDYSKLTQALDTLPPESARAFTNHFVQLIASAQQIHTHTIDQKEIKTIENNLLDSKQKQQTTTTASTKKKNA